MAKITIKDPVTTLDFGGGATNYDAQISEVSIELQQDSAEATNADSSGWKEFVTGLKGYSVTINFRKDTDLSGLSLAAFDNLDSGTGTVAFVFQHATGSVSAALPSFSGTLMTGGWKWGGAVGSLFEHSQTMTGTGALARVTS